MPRSHAVLSRHAIAAAVLALLTACGSSDYVDVAPVATAPAAPADPAFVENVPAPVLAAFIDNAATNQQSQTTVDVNAGVRVLAPFLDVWRPVTQTIDVTTWDGLQGTVLNQAVHDKNIQYVVDATTQRTAAQATNAYLDDRQNQAYSIVDGMGPLTAAWRAGSKATTTITAVAPDATTTAPAMRPRPSSALSSPLSMRCAATVRRSPRSASTNTRGPGAGAAPSRSCPRWNRPRARRPRRTAASRAATRMPPC